MTIIGLQRRLVPELAWAAGLFEGEGTIRLRQQSHVHLQLTTTDEDVLRRFHQVVGCGQVHARKPYVSWKPHYKDQWVWECTKTRASLDLLGQFLPWLGERRSELANAAFEMTGWRQRTCACGTQFWATRPERIWCSNTCRNASAHIRRKERLAHH